MLPWLYQPQYKPLLVNFIPKTRKSMTTTSQLKLDRHKNVVELNQLMGSQWNPPSWCQDLKQTNTETDVNKLWDFLQLKIKAWIHVVSWYIYKNNYEWQSWHAVHVHVYTFLNEWVIIVLRPKWAIFQLHVHVYHGKNKLHLDEIMKMSTLY